MPKMKTKSAAKKRFRTTATGKIIPQGKYNLLRSTVFAFLKSQTEFFQIFA